MVELFFLCELGGHEVALARSPGRSLTHAYTLLAVTNVVHERRARRPRARARTTGTIDHLSLSIDDRFTFAVAPTDSNDDFVSRHHFQFAKLFARGAVVPLPDECVPPRVLHPPRTPAALARLESVYKAVDLCVGVIACAARCRRARSLSRSRALSLSLARARVLSRSLARSLARSFAHSLSRTRTLALPRLRARPPP